ncbi:Protein GIGANTEA, partial [Cucurbita argyrosperma subsp. argyrosperma]
MGWGHAWTSPDGHDAALRLVPKARGKYQCHKSDFCVFFRNFEGVGSSGADLKGRITGSFELLILTLVSSGTDLKGRITGSFELLILTLVSSGTDLKGRITGSFELLILVNFFEGAAPVALIFNSFLFCMMASSSERWIDRLQFSSLFWTPPRDEQQRKIVQPGKMAEITTYVECLGQFTSEQFPEDIAELIRSHYPWKEKRLIDDVLATFVLHHPEHGHAVILPIISCIIDGSMVYCKSGSPFSSFISLFCPDAEHDYSEQWALACGEILRILTHYNRPIYKTEQQNMEGERSGCDTDTTTSDSSNLAPSQTPSNQERKPLRPLSPWITDILLAAPLGIRSDYFRWCSGVMGKYAAGELKPPTTATSRGSGKHPQLVPSTPRWAVANGAGVILSVCDEEVARYETATLTAAAVPALLLPPPTTALDEHLVAGLPALEPYARLFHRYYAIATPSATQRLLLGLLEAPPSWAPDALDAAVQLVELLRAAEDYASGIRLPRNWMHLHFLRAIGTAMSMRVGIAADAAAALLFRILSQPALLFPPLRQVEGAEIQHEPLGDYISSYRRQIEVPAAEATIEATAQGIASMLCAHGLEVEWRICTIWEAAYGLIPLSSSAVDLPEIVVATPLQPPLLSWNLYIPLLKVLEYLPRGSPSEACLMKIFVATVEAILQRAFPSETSSERTRKLKYLSGIGCASKNLSLSELRMMVHSLFLESCASEELASRLLFIVLTVCVSHEAQSNGRKKRRSDSGNFQEEERVEPDQDMSRKRKETKSRMNKQGPVSAFDSYVLAAVCALACELQLFPLMSRGRKHSSFKSLQDVAKLVKINGSSFELQSSIDSAIRHTHRILSILEALFSLKPSSLGTSWSYSSNEIVAAAMVAAHVSELFRRSRACMHALSVLMRCKWDEEIYTRASSLYNLIDIHSKAVASIVNRAEPLEVHLVHAPISEYSCVSSAGRKPTQHDDHVYFETGQQSVPKSEESCHVRSKLSFERASDSNVDLENTLGKRIASFQLDASELANFLTIDRHIGFNGCAQILLRSVLAEKQELCFSVVSLLWHKLIATPEIQPSAEGTSALQGWRQVVDALCNVVSASPAKAAAAVVLQADKEFQPWIAKDDNQGQKMWRINQRIIKLIVELMRNHDTLESLITLASASDLLLRATDGMLVDGEACTLPQLELLEATARAVGPVLELGESGLSIADGLANLLKCRLPATVRCLSHPSAHVRTLSTSVLRDILQTGSYVGRSAHKNINGVHSSSFQYFDMEAINWKDDLEKCLTWEAHSRLVTGMPIEGLHVAAKELGCSISL